MSHTDDYKIFVLEDLVQHQNELGNNLGDLEVSGNIEVPRTGTPLNSNKLWEEGKLQLLI